MWTPMNWRLCAETFMKQVGGPGEQFMKQFTEAWRYVYETVYRSVTVWPDNGFSRDWYTQRNRRNGCRGNYNESSAHRDFKAQIPLRREDKFYLICKSFTRCRKQENKSKIEKSRN